MLLLTLTTDKIQLKTDVTCDVDTTCSWTDRNQSTGVVGLTSREHHTITTAGTTDIVAVPGATTTRHVETMLIQNVDAVKTVTVTILYNANSTLYELFKVILYAGDQLKYGFDTGFKYLPVNGVSKAPKFACVVAGDGGAEGVRLGGASSVELAAIAGLTVLGLKPNKRYSYFGALMHRSENVSAGLFLGGTVVNRGGTSTDFLFDELTVLTVGAVSAALIAGSTTSQWFRPMSPTTSNAGSVLSLVAGTFLHSGSYGMMLGAGREQIVSTNTFHQIDPGSWLLVWEAAG